MSMKLLQNDDNLFNNYYKWFKKHNYLFIENYLKFIFKIYIWKLDFFTWIYNYLSLDTIYF